MTLDPKILADNLILYGLSTWENTVKVLPPDAKLWPKGRIVLQLGEPRASAGFVVRDLTDDAGTEVALTAVTTHVAYPLDPSTQTNATDNQIIRLRDNTLLAIKNGYVWNSLANKPAWFDTVDVKFNGAAGSQTSKRARNAVLVFHSEDGGETWKLRSLIDAAVVENGDYGWPQGNGSGQYGVGGFDRTEVYEDPWTGAIYVSGHGDGGPYVTNDGNTVAHHAGIIFVSKDGGKSWSTLYKKFGSGAPYVMTSTRDYPLVVFRLTGKGPWLHLLDAKTGKLDDGQLVVATSNGQVLASGTDAETNDLRGSPPCIARIGTENSVRIAYPTLNGHGRQNYVVARVVLGSGPAVVDSVSLIHAEDSAKASCVLGAFIQDDEAGNETSNGYDFSLFYWIEAPPKNSVDKDKLLARFKMFSGSSESRPAALSVSGGHKRYFARSASGDYFSGACFHWQHDVCFLAQWREEDGIKGNVVRLHVPPARREIHEVAIDPLALILSDAVYVRLTLPDPPPIDLLTDQVDQAVSRMSADERKRAEARADAMAEYAKALKRSLLRARGNRE